jgi:DNA ligase 1
VPPHSGSRVFARCAIAAIAFIASLSVPLAQAEVKSAAPILLANVLAADVDPSNYLVSEKFDGVRAIWDGAELRFRSGRIVAAPTWFIDKLPKHKLDGELWLGHGKFEVLSGMVRKSEPLDDDWRQISYLIFELPDAPGTFEVRAARIREIVFGAQWPQLIAVEQKRGTNRAALRDQLNRVVKNGGEGLMLHLADAPYVTGRSDVLLKLKPLDDTEAKVVEHLAGKGKFTGVMGAMRVQMPSGRQFVIGTGFTDAQRKNPPPIGANVTYTYRGFTNTGLPRFASFLRVRAEP